MEAGRADSGAQDSSSGLAAVASEPKKRAPDGPEPAEGDCIAKQPRLQEGTGASGGPSAAKTNADSHRGDASDYAGSASSPFTPLTAAFSEDKGCRQTMEDVCVLQLDARPQGQHPACRLAHFGVFDGHGGMSCAAYAAKHLHRRVLDCGLLRKGLNASAGKVDAKACKACIVEGFKSTDEALLKECSANSWQDGACAVSVWVLEDLVLVANVGDAKCVLARTPEQANTNAGAAVPSKPQPRAIVLTKEHTALLERQRIEKAGGTVVNGRLAGRIQIARSFGDAAFKKLGCSSSPDVTAFPLTPRDSFLLLGCDGFWGVFGAQEAVDTAQALLAEGLPAKAVTNRVLNMAVREKRCKDNCSVMLITFGAGADVAAGEAS